MEGLQHIGYPACAGIDMTMDDIVVTTYRLPRMRGDRPIGYHPYRVIDAATPHARGSTALRVAEAAAREGYPACAGIDPCSRAHGH